MATTFIIGDYEYSIIEGEGYDHKIGARVIDTTKSSYGPLLKNPKYNGETYTLIWLLDSDGNHGTFEGCTNLIVAPEIPDSVIYMDHTFEGCTSLTGDIIVHNSPLNYTDIFKDTIKPIVIINRSNDSIWQTIADNYSNASTISAIREPALDTIHNDTTLTDTLTFGEYSELKEENNIISYYDL